MLPRERFTPPSIMKLFQVLLIVAAMVYGDVEKITGTADNCTSGAATIDFETEPNLTGLEVVWELNLTVKCNDDYDYETAVKLTLFDRTRNTETCVDYPNITANDAQQEFYAKQDCFYLYKVKPNDTLTLSYSIRNLRPCTAYNVEAQLLSKNGTPLVTVKETVQTDSIVLNQIQNLTITPMTDAIRLSWVPHEYEHDCDISYDLNVTSPRMDIPYRRYENATPVEHLVRRLSSCTAYNISIVPSNYNATVPVEIYTRTTLPDQVLDARLEFETDNFTRVSWRPPRNRDCIQGYRVSSFYSDEDTTDDSFTYEGTLYCVPVEVAGVDHEGNVGRSVTLLKPGPVWNLTIDIVTDQTLAAKWDKPEHADCVSGYVVELNGKRRNTTELTHVFFGLSDCTVYNVRVAARAGSHLGDFTSTEVTINPLKPPKCKQLNVEKTRASFSCSTTDDHHENLSCGPTNVTIQCGDNLGSEMVLESGKPSIKIAIEGLDPYTEYTCVGVTGNDLGESQKNRIDRFRTLQDVPGPPVNVELSLVTSRSFRISWEQPLSLPGEVVDYGITVRSNGPSYITPPHCQINTDEVHVTTQALEYDFEGALPSYSYRVYVNASTEAGYGEQAETEDFETDGEAPEPPENLNYNVPQDGPVSNDINVSIRWTRPCSTNGPLKHFRVRLTGTPLFDSEPHTIPDEVPEEPDLVEYERAYLLRPAHTYVISVTTVAQDDSESGPAETQFDTPEGIPEAPVSASITEPTPDGFKVAWTEPPRKNGLITLYRVTVRNEGALHDVPMPDGCQDPPASQTFNVSGDVLSYVYGNGPAYYRFSASIVACLARTCGPPSGDPLPGETSDAEPEAARSIDVQTQLEEREEYTASATVSFERPCYFNGMLRHFAVVLNGTRPGHGGHHVEVLVLNEGGTVTTIPIRPDYDYVLGVAVVTTNHSKLETKLFKAPSGVPPNVNQSSLSAPEVMDNDGEAEFMLRRDLFDDRNGQVLYYALIIGQKGYEEGPTFGFWEGTTNSWPPVVGEAAEEDEDVIGAYQATPNFWNPFDDEGQSSYTYKLGDGSEGNPPLVSGTVYTLKVRGFTGEAYRDSPTVIFEIVGLDLALILGLTFGILLTLTLCGFVFVLWRRRSRTRRKGSVESAVVVPVPISVRQFPKCYAELKANGEKLKQEFSLLGDRSTELILPGFDGMLPENRKKNRYTNILPYDETRVKLIVSNERQSDYINASYIKGYSGDMEYIAMQGPLEQTCEDFWEMVMQENVSLVVMVAQFVEQNKEKCFQYFPANQESMDVGADITVRCCTELDFTSYVVRTLQVQKDLQQQTVTHLQFTDWPDFGCPVGTDVTLEFCQLMREHAERNRAPIVVHCSAGVGRTGTLIALDILLQNINHKKDVDIFGTVLNLRKDRKSMVQTEKQYLYIYNCVNDFIEYPTLVQFGNTLHDPIYENLDEAKKKPEDIKESQF